MSITATTKSSLPWYFLKKFIPKAIDYAPSRENRNIEPA